MLGTYHQIGVGEQPVGVPSFALGAVERTVSALQHHRRVDVALMGHGQADRGGDLEAVSLEVVRLRQREDESLRQLGGILDARDGGLEHGKLVTADPRRLVARPQDRTDAIRNCLQQAIACRVPPCIVHDLEAVEVDAEDGEAFATSPHPRQGGRETIVE